LFKRRVAVWLGVLLSLALLLSTACGTSSGGSGASSGPKLKVGLVTDVNKIDDKSFNQAAWEGVQRAQKELGAEIKFIETTDPKDYAKNIDLFVNDKYDVIVTVGFGLGEATIVAAKKYPNVKFIGVDQSQADPIPNLAGLIFDDDKAGFLAGALAAQMTKSGTIGQVLGTDVVPAVVKFGKGFENGAKYGKADVKVLTWYHPGGLARGFSDPEEGKKQANQMISQGADVVFAAGGLTGNGGLLACAEKNVLAIGVDSDQYLTLPQAQKVLLTSAIKLITPGVFNIVKSARDGAFKGGNVVGEVGLAPYHDQEKNIPQAVKDKMVQIDKGLKDGSIKTNVTL
jgi:basic membrane protein A